MHASVAVHLIWIGIAVDSGRGAITTGNRSDLEKGQLSLFTKSFIGPTVQPSLSTSPDALALQGIPYVPLPLLCPLLKPSLP